MINMRLQLQLLLFNLSLFSYYYGSKKKKFKLINNIGSNHDFQMLCSKYIIWLVVM